MALPHPDERTAEIAGRRYQLPEITESVVRDLFTPAALPPPGNSDEPVLVAQPIEENPMQIHTTMDPNATLNGPEPAAPDGGFFATLARYCTLRNGVIAGTVVLIGTAVYCAVTREVPEITA